MRLLRGLRARRMRGRLPKVVLAESAMQVCGTAQCAPRPPGGPVLYLWMASCAMPAVQASRHHSHCRLFRDTLFAMRPVPPPTYCTYTRVCIHRKIHPTDPSISHPKNNCAAGAAWRRRAQNGWQRSIASGDGEVFEVMRAGVAKIRGREQLRARSRSSAGSIPGMVGLKMADGMERGCEPREGS